MKPCAVVLGSYVNGYSMIQELHEKGVRDIILIAYGKNVANFSNKIKRCIIIRKNDESLFDALDDVRRTYDYIVPFPSDDFQVEALSRISARIRDYCFLPFNPDNVMQSGDKIYQYQCCEKLGIPYPKTKEVTRREEYDALASFMFPLIIKPTKRLDIITDVFRSLQVLSVDDLERHRASINGFLERGMSFLASEFIPGHTNGTIVAYTAYRSHDGRILNEWIGKKLSQYPDDYGVFSSASNQCDPVILEQGRSLLNGMNLVGINEPEFKYDSRDGKYKLMEINLRSMMWHRVGNLSGVNIQYTQWLDALNQPVQKQEQDRSRDIHYCYYKHEIYNLLNRKNYFKQYRYNLKGGDENHLAVKDRNDIKPYLYDRYVTYRGILTSLIKKLIRRAL